jgi:hypothetical protein
LEELLKSRPGTGRQVVFIDEFPWLDTKGSDFRESFALFWNSYAAKDPRVMLVVCGSATAWIVNHLLKDKGALHNRVTGRIQLQPFTLGECEQFFTEKGVVLNRYQQLESYMVFGGIPYYLDLFDPSFGLTQNVDRLCFASTGALAGEYDELYRSLFQRPERHQRIVETLAVTAPGMTREELAAAARLAPNGHLTAALRDLEQSGFISKQTDFTKRANGAYFRLIDPFTRFHLRFMAPGGVDEHFWTNGADEGARHAWKGLAFEQVCLAHVPQIKRRLGISGVSTTARGWRSREAKPEAQIDLVLDRRDGVINLCEAKYTTHEYSLSRDEFDVLQRRRDTFAAETGTRKALHLTLITTYGLVRNATATAVQADVTMDDLFADG